MSLHSAALVAVLPWLALSSCAPTPSGGYISTEAASWSATHNQMPGAPRQLLIQGEVTVAAANYDASVHRRPKSERPPHYDVRVQQGGGVGAQVLTRQKVRYQEPYNGNDRRIILHFPDGQTLPVPVVRPH